MTDDQSIRLKVARLKYLSKAGNFVAAKSLWTEDLAHRARGYHHDIAYIDCLRRQNAYGEIEDFVTGIVDQSSYTEREQKLLALNLAYARIFVHGALRFAIQEARAMRSLLATEDHSLTLHNQVRAVELFVRIVKYGFQHSTFISEDELELPGVSPKDDVEGPWTTSYQWFHALVDAKCYWEALTLLNLMSSIPKNHVLAGFETLLNSVKTEPGREIDLFRIATTIGLSRFQSSKDDPVQGKETAALAQQELDKFCLQTADPEDFGHRQSIELKLAFLELLPETADRLDEYEVIAQLARRSMDFSYEDYILDARARVAAKLKLYDKLEQCRSRLLEVQSSLKRDAVSMLETTCGLWRANYDKKRGALQNLFNQFDNKYPIGSLSGTPSPMKWDLPSVRAREQYLKFLNSRTLALTDQIAPTMRLSNTLLLFTPTESIKSGLGIQNAWLFEWFTPLSPQPLDPFSVLTNRMHVAVKDGQHDERSLGFLREFFVENTELTDDASYSTSTISFVTSNQVRSLLFPTPLDQTTFLRRMNLLSAWFSSDDLFSKDASDNLLAELYRQRIFAGGASGNNQADWQALEGNTARYVHFVQHETSGIIREHLHTTVLAAKRTVLEMAIKFPFPKPQQMLQGLLHSFDNLRAEYSANEQLAGNVNAQASLVGWSSVVALAMADLDQFEQRHAEAQAYYDELRSELSAFDAQVALQAKADLREVLGGSKATLRRSLNDLVTMYFSTEVHTANGKSVRGRIACLVWDLIQESKNRAMNDVISEGSNPNPSPSLPEPVRIQIEGWQRQLEAVRHARKTGDLLAVEKERETLRALEASLLETEGGRAALTLYKGKSITIAEMRLLAKEQRLDKMVLVDWFTADTTIAALLHLVVIRLSPDREEHPQIFQLLGMGRKAVAWVAKYLTCGDPAGALEGSSAYPDLQTLQGLVQPLVETTSAEDALVFCPTTEWQIHRLPLHAIELPERSIEYALEPLNINPSPRQSGAAGRDYSEDYEDNRRVRESRSLLYRNSITYTYSYSLLRHSLHARHGRPNGTGSARVISPLAATAPPDPTLQQMRNVASLFNPQSTRTNTGSSVNLPNVEADILASDFVYFFGHIHPAEVTNQPTPLSAHLLLFVDDPISQCPGLNLHAENERLTGDRIVSDIKMSQGAHVALVACGGGVSSARVTDDVLGLVPAFFLAGASSATAVLWEIPEAAALEWTRLFCVAWRKQTASAAFTGEVNVAACAQSASRSLCRQRGFADVVSWAGWTHFGNWNFHI